MALSAQLTAATLALQGVLQGRSLTPSLEQVSPHLRPAAQALSFDAMRHLGAARWVLHALAPRAPQDPVQSLLLLGLALLWPRPAPPYDDHTLVDQAVRCAKQLAPHACGMVNAVLRRFVRERAAWAEQARVHLGGIYHLPTWWQDRLRADWPEHATSWMAHAAVAGAMVLRVNRRRTTVAAYTQQLAAAGMVALPHPHPLCAGHALVLERAVRVSELPGFAEGWVSIQDAAAQMAAPLLLGGGDAPHALRPLASGARVLDACAAPGGKTTHLLELADLDVLALDHDGQRLARVHDSLNRLGLQARCLVSDAASPPSWWDGLPFDAILLDAPCTASGIVRRHPDVAWLRRASDIAQLARTQAQLLDALWPTLAPGGRLLYATCSLFREEGQAQIDAFLQRQPSGSATLSHASPGHLQPVADNASAAFSHDGFFYALLLKRP